MKRKHGPVGLVHVDAHADVNDTMFGEKIAHGTPFRRAVEEGLLDGKRCVQIGLRGTGYAADDFDWPRQQGFRVVQAEECWHKSLAPLMAEVREQVKGGPVYLSFDIDGLDPGFAPGTGTPEIGGLTAPQALEIIRGCRGLDLVGGDLVEVSPPYDPSGNTALTRRQPAVRDALRAARRELSELASRCDRIHAAVEASRTATPDGHVRTAQVVAVDGRLLRATINHRLRARAGYVPIQVRIHPRFSGCRCGTCVEHQIYRRKRRSQCGSPSARSTRSVCHVTSRGRPSRDGYWASPWFCR